MKTNNVFPERLSEMRRQVKEQYRQLPNPYPQVVLFFSASNGKTRAQVFIATGQSFEAAWQKGLEAVRNFRTNVRWLRVDWPVEILPSDWAGLRQLLATTKRNYFRLGIALDTDFAEAFLEQELNANAMFYGGNQVETAILNEKNVIAYFKQRFEGRAEPDFADDAPVHIFSSMGVFMDGDALHQLHPSGPDAGRRILADLNREDVTALVTDASRHLARQVGEDGTFVYGYHPCFDRQIQAYNTLRHASSTYAMIEAFEVTGDAQLAEAIHRAIGKLTQTLIRPASLPDGTPAAFLTEANDEIKLGGNAVAILALVKHAAVFDTRDHDDLMTALAAGIRHMQDASGAFCHVLTYPALETKAQFRTIYYEGEATFALMRLFEYSGDERWLDTVELAVRRFIAENYGRHHDHWLAYCLNELTRHRPQKEYFQLAINNVAGYLDFVANRITTFPTLLELMMATSETLLRLDGLGRFDELFDRIDMEEFAYALDKRTQHLLNGHFWPEYAMFMRNPARVLGSFFIRHHAFRVRIDDVEHYLSGFVAYLRHLDRIETFRTCVATRAQSRRLAAE